METLRLDGNPITVGNPGLSSCFGKDVARELSKYFAKGDSPSIQSSFLNDGFNDAASLRKKVAEL